MDFSPTSFNMLTQAVDALSTETQRLAQTLGDDIQELQQRVEAVETAVIGADIRIVSPPDNDRSVGRVGNFAFDREHLYLYIGNNTDHKWGQIPMITQFIRETL